MSLWFPDAITLPAKSLSMPEYACADPSYETPPNTAPKQAQNASLRTNDLIRSPIRPKLRVWYNVWRYFLLEKKHDRWAISPSRVQKCP